MQGQSDVIVIGAGIIGVACADALARRGLRVRVIDKGDVGHGCSFGNAGWITPCFALPLPMPGMLVKALGWMLDSRSPLYIQPRLSVDLARWLVRFVRSMNRPLMERSVAALVPMAKASLAAFRELSCDASSSFGFEQKGLLIVAQSAEGMDGARLEMNLVGQHGVVGQELGEAEIRHLEPAITGGPLRGGVYFPEEAHCEPLAAVKALATRATKHGAQIDTGTEVFAFEICGNKVSALQTTRGRMVADQYVLATGAWSAELASKLGIRVPMMSGKGYAATISGIEPAPQIPLMLLEKKCAITPRANGVRIAGTLELVGMDDSITTRRLQSLLDSASTILNMPERTPIEVWRGLRPCTPDGVPIIGRPRKLHNLVIAAGHQLLGLLTAPATGSIVADLIMRQPPSFDTAPFSADRF